MVSLTTRVNTFLIDTKDGVSWLPFKCTRAKGFFVYRLTDAIDDCDDLIDHVNEDSLTGSYKQDLNKRRTELLAQSRKRSKIKEPILFMLGAILGPIIGVFVIMGFDSLDINTDPKILQEIESKTVNINGNLQSALEKISRLEESQLKTNDNLLEELKKTQIDLNQLIHNSEVKTDLLPQSAK